MPENFVLLLMIGLTAGVMSGLFGIGGGVIIVPALIVFATFEPVEAIGTSLGALLLPVGILAVIAYYRAQLIDLRGSMLIALGLLTTSWLGAQITLGLPEDTLKQVYGVFLVYVSWRFVEPRKIYAEWQTGRVSPDLDSETPAEEIEKAVPVIPVPPAIEWWVILLVGLTAGLASGMFGIGGGAVIVPALVAGLHYDQKLAVGTSLGALLLPVGLPGVLAYHADGELNLEAAMIVAVGLLLGAILGARIALNLPSRTVKRMYGMFLFLVGWNFILQIF